MHFHCRAPPAPPESLKFYSAAPKFAAGDTLSPCLCLEIFRRKGGAAIYAAKPSKNSIFLISDFKIQIDASNFFHQIWFPRFCSNLFFRFSFVHGLINFFGRDDKKDFFYRDFLPFSAQRIQFSYRIQNHSSEFVHSILNIVLHVLH